MINMCTIKGDYSRLIPWWFVVFKPLKIWCKRDEHRSAISNKLAGIFLQELCTLDLLLYLKFQSDWLWWWDQKLGFLWDDLNSIKWKRTLDLMCLFPLENLLQNQWCVPSYRHPRMELSCLLIAHLPHKFVE